MTKTEKDLRQQIKVAVPNQVLRRSMALKVGKLIRETREEDARIFVGEMRRRIDLKAFGMHGIEDKIAALVLSPRKRA